MKNWTKKHISIQHTWDGLALSPEQWINVKLHLQETSLNITFSAPFYGDPPPPAPPSSYDGLWDYEVVEIFIAHGKEYTEIECGPHGHFLVLQLDGIRNRVASELPLDYTSTLTGNHWEGTAQIALGYLPPFPWTFNVYAIHGLGKNRTYKAAFPPGGEEPDFHRLESFKSFR